MYRVCIIFTPQYYFIACTCFQSLNMRSFIYNFPVYPTLCFGTMFCIVPFVLTNAVLQVNGIEVFMGNRLFQDGLNIPHFQKLSVCVIKHWLQFPERQKSITWMNVQEYFTAPTCCESFRYLIYIYIYIYIYILLHIFTMSEVENIF